MTTMRNGLDPMADSADRQAKHGPAAFVERTVAADIERAQSGGSSASIVANAVTYLGENYTQPVTLRDLEAVTTCSIYQIIRAFRRDLGTTPHAYLMRLRVRHATRLLLEGEPIVGAAAEAGFADQSHFTRCFKRLHGVTPGEYLRQRARWRAGARHRNSDHAPAALPAATSRLETGRVL